MRTLDFVDESSLRDDVPDLRPGDNVKVHVKVVEGNRSRVQVFQGNIIGIQGDGLRETFTVRKISFGVGVERVFPVHSPIIEKIEVVSHGDVRRAKLYYLRDLSGKAAKIRESQEDVADAKAKKGKKDKKADKTAEDLESNSKAPADLEETPETEAPAEEVTETTEVTETEDN